VKANLYETERYLHEYLLFHYGQAKDVCPFPFVPRELLRFHPRLRQECLKKVSRNAGQRTGRRVTRALDIGCAVGRFTFELGRLVDEATGIDNSSAFIQAAQKLARHRSLAVQVKESGEKLTTRKLVLPQGLRRSAVKFYVGDAMDLSPFEARPFDIVAAVNLLCRLPRPRQFLQQLHRLVIPGGQLLIASPFSWLEEYTPRREWLTPQDTRDLLRPHFHQVRRRDIPFLIREHRRKYQLVVSEVLVFQRR
jgi:putative 4-mercaptohistidine N1-methyltranferase